MIEKPPPGFDEAFFDWIGRASNSLSVTFAWTGALPEEDVQRFERELGFSLPEDIRRFYRRFSP